MPKINHREKLLIPNSYKYLRNMILLMCTASIYSGTFPAMKDSSDQLLNVFLLRAASTGPKSYTLRNYHLLRIADNNPQAKVRCRYCTHAKTSWNYHKRNMYRKGILKTHDTYGIFGSTLSHSLAFGSYANAIDGSLLGFSISRYEHIAACRFLGINVDDVFDLWLNEQLTNYSYLRRKLQ